MQRLSISLSNTLLASAERAEIFHGLWNGVTKKSHHNTPSGLTTNLHIYVIAIKMFESTQRRNFKIFNSLK